MPNVNNLHTESSKSHASRKNVIAWLACTLGAFVVGGILVFTWYAVQLFGPALRLSPDADRIANFSIFANADRIGRPTTAPVLNDCIWKAMDIDLEPGRQPSALYTYLRAGTVQSRVSTTPGHWESKQVKRLAMTWGKLAECIAAHEGSMICDRDNRAVAVEATSQFLQHAREALPLFDRNSDDEREDIADIETMKNQVLTSLQSSIRDGIFIASDFGFSPPGEIRRIISEVKPISDWCKQVRR
jgi:hypothetical protein